MVTYPIRTAAAPRHAWTDEDRIILTLLFRFYENYKSSLLRIWSYINHDVLVAEGFSKGEILPTALISQFYEMKRTDTRIYKEVMEQPLTTIRNRYWRQKCRIEEAAQELGVTLTLRIDPPRKQQVQQQVAYQNNRLSFVRDDWSPSTASSLQSEISVISKPMPPTTSAIRAFAYDNEANQVVSATIPSDSTPSIVNTATNSEKINFHTRSNLPIHGINESTLHTDAQSTLPGLNTSFQGVYVPVTPKAKMPVTPYNNPLANVRSSPKLMTTFDSDGSHSRRHPVLLFRAFNPDHSLVARRFLHGKAIAVPPTVQSEDFKRVVSPHLRINKEYASPFLSLTQYPKYALRIISDSPDPKHLAVYLYNDLDDEGRMRNKMRPLLVPKIVDEHDLKDLPRCYRGRGEFLVWGRIDTKPILVLNTGQALELLGVLSFMKECSPEAASELYPFFKDVEVEYRETLVRSLAAGFKINGHDWHYHSANWESFANNLFEPAEDDHQSRRHTSVLSQVTVETSYLRIGEAYIAVEEEAGGQRDDTDQGVENPTHLSQDNVFNALDVDTHGPASRHELEAGTDYRTSDMQVIEGMDVDPATIGQPQGLRLNGDDDSSDIAAHSASPVAVPSTFPRVPVPAGFSSPVMIDLTDGDFNEMEGLAETHQSIPSQQEEELHLPQASGTSLAQAVPVDTGATPEVDLMMEDDGEIVIVSEGHRALSIRSNSRPTPAWAHTPTRMARSVNQQHVEDLDYD